MKAPALIRCVVLVASTFVWPATARADVFLANHSGQGIYRYDDSGAFVGIHPTPGAPLGPLGLSFGPDGGLYYQQYIGDEQTFRIDPVTGAVSVFVSGGYPSRPVVHQITFGGPGNDLYVAAPGSAAVVRFDGATGALEAQIDLDGDTQTVGVAVDSSGVVYSSSRHGVIRKYASGALSLFATAPTGWYEALAIGPDGNLYAGSSVDRVFRYKPDGTPFGAGGSTTDPTFIRDSRLSSAFSLGFDPDGRLYVVSPGSVQVLRYAADGSFVDTFISATPGLVYPSYLAFGALGPIPEPATVALLLAGIGVLALAVTGNPRSRRR